MLGNRYIQITGICCCKIPKIMPPTPPLSLKRYRKNSLWKMYTCIINIMYNVLIKKNSKEKKFARARTNFYNLRRPHMFSWLMVLPILPLMGPILHNFSSLAAMRILVGGPHPTIWANVLFFLPPFGLFEKLLIFDHEVLIIGQAKDWHFGHDFFL